jgi:putative SOS response-associated peptidase YedK
MCARYQTPSQAAAERYWRLTSPQWDFEESWRVLPTHQVPVVARLDGITTGRMMRWGLIPFRGEVKYPLINATVEKLETWYGWKYPWQRGQRCILLMAGFYEPHVFEGGRKEPFYVHLADRPVFGVAGLWERKPLPEGGQILSCTLITTPPNSLLAEVHNEKLRMPAVLREEQHEAWLNGTAEEAKAALTPYPSDCMVAWQVSRRLYANKTPNDASLIAPVAAAAPEVAIAGCG